MAVNGAGAAVRIGLAPIGIQHLHLVTVEPEEDTAIAAALAASDDSAAVALVGDASVPVELRAAAGLEGAMAGCDVIGGTAPRRVATALAAAKARLGL